MSKLHVPRCFVPAVSGGCPGFSATLSGVNATGGALLRVLAGWRGRLECAWAACGGGCRL